MAKAETAANAALAGAGVVLVAAFFYLVHTYFWTARLTASPLVWIYCLVPALSATVMVACLRLRPAYKVKIVVCLLSTAATLYCVEILAAVWFQLPSVRLGEARFRLARAAVAAGRQFDTRSNKEVVRDLRRQGIDAVPSVWPRSLLKKGDDDSTRSVISVSGVEVLPLGGISGKPTVLCNESGDFLVYQSDEHGFRNPRGAWNLGRVDVMAVGDSYAQGYCVPLDRDFISLIRQRHPATLSLGVQGNGPLVELASLKEYASVLKPRIVLWFYFEGNDFADLREERKSLLLRRYLTNEYRQELLGRQDGIDRAVSDYVEPLVLRTAVADRLAEISELAQEFGIQPSAIGAIAKFSWLRARLGLIPSFSKSYTAEQDRGSSHDREIGRAELIRLFRQILAEAQRATSEWGGRFYLVYLPERARYDPALRDVAPERNQVIQSAVELKIPVIDIHRAFTARGDPLALFPFRLAEHYNVDGQRVVAEEVLRAISTDRGRGKDNPS